MAQKPSVTLTVGNIYHFATRVPDEIGSKWTNVKCLAIMNAQTAIVNGVDITGMHYRVRSQLPEGVSDDPYSMTYIKFRNSGGVESIIPTAWINMDTLQETKSENITIKLKDASFEDMDNVRRLLLANGYSVKSISVD